MRRSITRLSFTFPIPKQLNEVARLPLLQQESPVKIRQLWLDQFMNRQDVVVGTMARAEFDSFKANSIACPMFLVPVTKNSDSSAYFNMVSQIQDGKHCLLSSLEDFRQNPTGASPLMVVTIYDELVADKGIALIRGDIINQLDISKANAAGVLKHLRHFYSNQFTLVKQFNKEPRSFDYSDFMQKHRQFQCSHSYGEAL